MQISDCRDLKQGLDQCVTRGLVFASCDGAEFGFLCCCLCGLACQLSSASMALTNEDKLALLTPPIIASGEKRFRATWASSSSSVLYNASCPAISINLLRYFDQISPSMNTASSNLY